MMNARSLQGLCLFTLLAFLHQATAQTDASSEDKLSYNLSWSLPIVIIFVIIVVMFAIVACVMYRQRRHGTFCCLKPMMRYRVEEPSQEEESQNGPPIGLPTYTSTKPPEDIAPPDYRDALQDVLVSSGEDLPVDPEATEEVAPQQQQEEEPTIPAPDDDSTESYEYDDRTPLNP